MKKNILPAIKLTLICVVFFCGVYLFTVFGISQYTTHQGKGETITHDGHNYYANVGQSFTEDKYFNSRPSAVNYNAAGAGGSNKGPSNPVYLEEVQARIDTFLAHNPGIKKADIPSDLVTASGSGLDPHISVQAANIQVKRIARLRNIPESVLEELIEKKTERPLFGFIGKTQVNVLHLNLALNERTQTK